MTGGNVIQIIADGQELPALMLAAKSVTLRTLKVSSLFSMPKKVKRAMFRKISDIMQSRHFTGIRGLQEFTYSEVRRATESLVKNPYIGLHALSIDSRQSVPVARRLTRPLELERQATYIIVGGLYGLGRSIATLLIEHGAKHIAFLQRSPPDESASEFLAGLMADGVDARSFSVDICIGTAVQQVVAQINSLMPRIAGCVQCAAVLADGSFASMTYDQFQLAFAPKTFGSWNLSNHLPSDMSFFLLLSSSAAVIGNRGQANYAAGNAFQDALARHRAGHGMHTVSLGLGLVLDAGMVARNGPLLDAMRAAGLFGTRLSDVLFLVARAINARHEGDEIPFSAHVVTAVGTGGLVLQNRPADPFWTRSPLFRLLNTVDAPPGATAASLEDASGESSGLRARLRGATNTEEAAEAVCAAFVGAVARRKGMAAADFAHNKTLDAYGIDSMDAIFLLG
jgi:NAD(P)-dependent dehydrogenase (short-subunit alcohol dehydrogenase family)